MKLPVSRVNDDESKNVWNSIYWFAADERSPSVCWRTSGKQRLSTENSLTIQIGELNAEERRTRPCYMRHRIETFDFLCILTRFFNLLLSSHVLTFDLLIEPFETSERISVLLEISWFPNSVDNFQRYFVFPHLHHQLLGSPTSAKKKFISKWWETVHEWSSTFSSPSEWVNKNETRNKK